MRPALIFAIFLFCINALYAAKSKEVIPKADTLLLYKISSCLNEVKKLEASQIDLKNYVSHLEDSLNRISQTINIMSPEKNTGFKGVTYEIDIISILISIIVILILIQIGKFIKRVAAEDESLVHKKSYQENINYSNKYSQEHRQEISLFEFRTLQTEVDKIRSELEKLRRKLEYSEIPLEIVRPNVEDRPENKKNLENSKLNQEDFFLSTPNSDGSFNASSIALYFKEGASIYRFTKINENRANFAIESKEIAIRLALQYPDKSIMPVCDSINEYESKYLRIVTISPGIAELTDGKWMVILKAKIKYES